MGADTPRAVGRCAVAMLLPVYTLFSSGAVVSRSEPAGAAVQASAPHGATWVIFLDDMHLDHRNTGRLKVLLETIASELIHDGDDFGIRFSHSASE